MQEHRDDVTEKSSNKTETRAEKVARLTKQAHEKVLRRKKKR